jgi:hypothetical protein
VGSIGCIEGIAGTTNDGSAYVLELLESAAASLGEVIAATSAIFLSLHSLAELFLLFGCIPRFYVVFDEIVAHVKN